MTLLPCISIHQPWASFIAHGIKTTEGRTHTRFAHLVGKRIAIHATKTWDREWRGKVPEHVRASIVAPWFERESGRTWADLLESNCTNFLIETFHMGKVIATAKMTGMIVVRCRWVDGIEREQLTHIDDRDVLYRLADVRKLAAPIPARGHQGVWMVEVPD